MSITTTDDVRLTMGQHVIAAPMVEEAAAQLLLGQPLTGLAALLL